MGKRVLIVEDFSQWQDLLSSILTSDGHEVVAVVTTANAAIAAAKEYKPDIITMDGRLADGSYGQDVAQEIRSLDPSVKIVMVAGYGSPTFEGVGFDKGKFDLADFRAAIEKV